MTGNILTKGFIDNKNNKFTIKVDFKTGAYYIKVIDGSYVNYFKLIINN
jgi:hypothetical protein